MGHDVIEGIVVDVDRLRDWRQGRLARAASPHIGQMGGRHAILLSTAGARSNHSSIPKLP